MLPRTSPSFPPTRASTWARWLGGLAILATLATTALATTAPVVRGADVPEVEFNRDIRPILSDNCFACHGPDQNKREAELRLDLQQDALAKRQGTPAIVPGNPEASELIRRVKHSDADLRMPPAESGKTLTPRQVSLLEQWIKQGAKFQEHWSFIPPKRAAIPTTKRPEWNRNPIDAFIVQRLEHERLEPSADADRRTLARRLYFDLLGLPPQPDEVDAFVADASPKAYEALVDRLLASEHYGERMATYWLDVVRYADTGGYHSDNHRDLSPYRDNVIRAFNSNMPFDQFTREQLAGDLLPNATSQQRIASGFNRLLQTTEEGGAQPREYTAKYAADRVRNTSVIWLGLTMGCAECHDHKFDPVTTRDFYSLQAFFADVAEKAVGRQDQTPVPTPEQELRLAKLDADLAALRAMLDRSSDPMLAPVRQQVDELAKQRAALVKSFPLTLVSMSVPPRTVRILPRGNWLDDSGEIVQPATPVALHPLHVTGRRPTRTDFADWLTAAENPLTARVFVNRLWKLCFGQGIVRSVEDLGTQGDWPTHPELLDWLAVEFRESGWNVKQIHKLMVMSHTYQQTSKADKRLREADPNNRLLARQARFRLDAEFVRDNALAISGLLTRTIGGPSVKPYQPAGYWANLNFPTREWQNDHGADLYRRGLYTYWCRTFLQPGLLAFDAPSREECVADRPRSNTPLQALVLLNDTTYVEAARALAARTLTSGGTTDAERLRFAMRQALARGPKDDEAKILSELLERHRQQFTADSAAATQLAKVGETPAPAGVNLAELAAWTSVARTILNLHETVTRN